MRRPPQAQRPATRRIQARATETQERLVAAALSVFSTRGFEGATTREIARKAGVALASLPYHFETKEALWRAAADRIFGLLRERFETRLRGLEGADVRTRLRLLLREFVLFAASHPELHRFMLLEGMDRGERMIWLVDTHVRPMYRIVGDLVAQGQAHGLLVEGRIEQLFYALIGVASLPYAVAPEYRLVTGTEPGAPALVEDHIQFALRLFRIDP